MVIGFDGSRAFTDKKTGTENYSYQLLKALAKIDKKNKYIVYVRNLSLVTCHLSPNFHFKEISWPRFWTQGGLALQTFKDELDVLFVPSHTLPIIKRPGLKTIITVHDLGSEYLPGMHQLRQRLYLSLMQRYQLKTAAKIIAVSNATQQDLIKKIDIEANKIEVVHEGWDSEKFKVQSSKSKIDTLVNSLRYYNLRPNNYYLFVGTVQPRKNLERIIKAYHQLTSENSEKLRIPESQNVRKSDNQEFRPTGLSGKLSRSESCRNPYLVIVGKRGWMSDSIYALPAKLGIEDKVKFLDYVKDEDLPALYSGAIGLVYPSLFEGFGLPILEAQACGCPVITSNISSMPEVAGEGAVLVDPYNAEEIVSGMELVQSSKFKVQSLKKAGFENIKRFSWEKCASETLHVLEEVDRSLV